MKNFIAERTVAARTGCAACVVLCIAMMASACAGDGDDDDDESGGELGWSLDFESAEEVFAGPTLDAADIRRDYAKCG